VIPLSLRAFGMMTSVGLDGPSTCAAIRCAISQFKETSFRHRSGKPLVGSAVPLETPYRGREKLVRFATGAIRECLQQTGSVKSAQIPLLLCVAEASRRGRLAGLDDRLFDEVVAALGVAFHPESSVISGGRVGGARALERARGLIGTLRLPFALVVGVDSFLVGPTLSAFDENYRLLTGQNSNGFIPGEAGCAVLLGPGTAAGDVLRIDSLGFGIDPATIGSDKPLRADGLFEAFRALKADAGLSLVDADYRYTDCNGEQYGFRNDRLAISRHLRQLKSRFDHLHPADCIGEVGAAVVPCILGLALEAARKNYAPGPGVLGHVSNDTGERAAFILRPPPGGKR